MAEVRIERKEGGTSVWPWLIAVVVLALVGWWLWRALANRQEATGVSTATSAATAPVAEPSVITAAPGTGATPQPGVEAATPYMPLAAIRANPDAHFGTQVSGLARVTEVVSDRGFWIEQDGARIFVVKAESLPGGSAEMTVGAQVSLTGTVVNPDRMQQEVPGILELGDGTLKGLQGEPAILHATNIEMQAV